MAIAVYTEGFQEISNFARRFQQRSMDSSPAMKVISLSLLKSVDKTFRSQGRPARWAPLSAMTLAMRRKGGGSGSPQILQDKGRLKQSLKNFFNAVRAGVGTSLSYAGIHQTGGTKRFPAKEVSVQSHVRSVAFGRSVKPFTIGSYRMHVPARTVEIPQRKFLQILREDSRLAVRILKDFLTRGKS